ncbi:TatD family hydrolase [Lysobacter sp. 2RAF19]
MYALVDTHCHLDVAEFDADRDAVVARAREVGVTRQIVPAIQANTWPALRDACARDAGLFPAYGLHPMMIAAHREAHLRELRDWIERERPVAIGECGLDFWVEDLDRDVQATFFDAQLVLAREFDLPVIVHARRAVDAVMAAIKRVGNLRGVIHSYAGSEEQARQLADLGFLIGIGGPVTYARANRVRRVAASVPLETLLLETDAPDQPDCGHRGQRNEPARMVRVLETVAELRGEDPGVIAKATTWNAERLFGLG